MVAEQTSGSRTCALVGTGRAGGAVALALVGAGWRVIRVAGRSPDAASVVRAAEVFGAEATAVADAPADAALVILAVPDASIEDVARAVVPTCAAGSLVLHLSGARGLDALAPITESRDDVDLGALHPLQTFPSAEAGAARLPGSWAAVAGPSRVADMATSIGLVPFVVRDADRAAYHAAASVASNHLVALLGQVERIAAAAGTPFAAFEPLVRATVDNAFGIGPAAALTGPVARGDVATVVQHLEAVDEEERATYRALALAAARLAGRHDDAELREALA